MKKILKYLLLILTIISLFFSICNNVFADDIDYSNYHGYRVPRHGFAASGHGPYYTYIYDADLTERGSISDFYITDYGTFYALKFPYFILGPGGTDISFTVNEYDWSYDNNVLVGNTIEGVIYISLFDNTKFKFGNPGSDNSRVGFYDKHSGAPYINNEDIDYYVNYIQEDDFIVTALHFKFRVKDQFYSNIMHLLLDTDDKDNFSNIQPFVLGYHFETSDEGLLDHTNENKILDSIDEDNNYIHGDHKGPETPDVDICTGSTIECLLQDILNGIKDWLNGVFDFWIDLLKPLFVPNSDLMYSLTTEFMDWFDKKLGFLGYPFTFTYDFLNRFLSLNDTGHYLISWPDIKVANFDFTIISAFNYDLASILNDEKINNMHEVYLNIIDGICSIAFVLLCYKKYKEVFGGTDEPSETLTESSGYSIDDKGVIHTNYSFNHRKTYKLKNGRVKGGDK